MYLNLRHIEIGSKIECIDTFTITATGASIAAGMAGADVMAAKAVNIGGAAGWVASSNTAT